MSSIGPVGRKHTVSERSQSLNAWVSETNGIMTMKFYGGGLAIYVGRVKPR